MKPEWVLKYKKPGCTIKEINGKYYLYYATSRYDPNKSYPVSIQTYIGRITPEGVVSERVSIDISKTEAKQMKELYPGIEQSLGSIILLHVKGEWYFTKLTNKQIRKLEEKGLLENGKLVVRNI